MSDTPGDLLPDDDFDHGLVLPEEGGLFARDIDGQLVRMDKVTAADFEKQITIKVDGREVTVPKAVPLTDAQGKLIRDAEGAHPPGDHDLRRRHAGLCRRSRRQSDPRALPPGAPTPGGRVPGVLCGDRQGEARQHAA